LSPVKVHIRNPDRQVEVPGPKRVRDLLAELELDPDTVLVISEEVLPAEVYGGAR
jgi:sulfur carrier protein ThiS